jgi:murein DD-endopeptidase MepM/ murein hydrolase activator NlpD
VPPPRRRTARFAVAAILGPVLLASGWLAAAHWMRLGPQPAALSQADIFGLAPATAANPGQADLRAGLQESGVSQQPQILKIAVARPRGKAPAIYLNPLRAVAGLVPERIDEGVDFGGTGPVYALGDGVVTNAGYNGGWPGGGWVTYRLTDGPDAGLMVYLAEDVTPAVSAGQIISPTTVIATMFNGGDGIETGRAQSTGVSAESELAEAGGIGGGGPFPTQIGANFDELLQLLGVPAAPNAGQPAYGLLPANYPATWG